MIRLDLHDATNQIAAALALLTPWIAGVAFLLTLIGYYSQVWQQRHDPPRMIQSLGLIGLVVVLAFSSEFWWPLLVNLMYFPAEELARQGVSFRINEALNHFLTETARLVSDHGTGDNGHGQLSPVWNFTWNFTRITRAGIADLVIHGMVTLFTFLAALLVLPFYFLQHFVVAALAKGLPIAICALTVPALRSRAAAFFSLTLSLLAWPTGFTLVAFVTNTVLSTSFVPPNASPAATALAPAIQTLVAALVMVFGTLLVPPTLLYLFLHDSAPGPGAAAPPR